ncbi:MAG TPA: hypothetical protein DCL77_02505 [Prolixibacteraceae bacterium]|jgi:hypothetical protein|nr:hypothetical protein [Prolixibacteraceae bacterium]
MYQEENTEPEFLKRPKSSPFRTPDHYFDSIEDRVMGSIKKETKKERISGSRKVYLLLKPVIGIAASLLLVYLLASFPIKHFSTKNNLVKSASIDTTSGDTMDAYSLNLSLIDENSLMNTIFGDDSATPAKINPDEVLAYLSTDMTDLEICSEIQN